MITLHEITTKCPPELLTSRDYPAIAAAVSTGRVKVTQHLGGIGTVLETLGPVDGAALLDQLESLAGINSAVKWAFVLINRGELDFGSPTTRAMIDMLVPEPARTVLKSVAETPDPISAAEVEVALKNDDGSFKT